MVCCCNSCRDWPIAQPVNACDCLPESESTTGAIRHVVSRSCSLLGFSREMKFMNQSLSKTCCASFSRDLYIKIAAYGSAAGNLFSRSCVTCPRSSCGLPLISM